MEKQAEARSSPERESRQGALNVLVYGAGVLGSLYAARLQQSGCNVSILARGQRLAELREHGIVLELEFCRFAGKRLGGYDQGWDGGEEARTQCQQWWRYRRW